MLKDVPVEGIEQYLSKKCFLSRIKTENDMKTIGIFYGSETGTTADVARRIAKELGVSDADIHDVAKTSPVKLGDYDVLLLGSSTWGAGDMAQDWYDFIAGAQALDLAGKQIAVFGCGDESMSDTFCDAVGEIYDKMKETGAEMIGHFNGDGYEYSSSKAERDGEFVGLVLDEVNHSDLTDGRIKAWADVVRSSIAD